MILSASRIGNQTRNILSLCFALISLYVALLVVALLFHTRTTSERKNESFFSRHQIGTISDHKSWRPMMMNILCPSSTELNITSIIVVRTSLPLFFIFSLFSYLLFFFLVSSELDYSNSFSFSLPIFFPLFCLQVHLPDRFLFLFNSFSPIIIVPKKKSGSSFSSSFPN